MTWLRILALRIKGLFRRSQHESDLDAELRSHLDALTEENIRRGMNPEEARYAARREFGGVEQAKELYRERRGLPFLETLLQDIRFGARMLAKNSGFTIVVVLTLALGIGVNAAIFSIVDWLTLRLPPIANPERVATLALQQIDGGHSAGFSYPDFVDIRIQSTAVFPEMAASLFYPLDGLSVDGNSQSMRANYVTGNFFDMMGLKPAIGSFIEPMPGRSVDDEPVLGYAFWKTHFGGDVRVVGKSVLINGHPVTIIGVAPKGFHGLGAFVDVQGYLPLGMASITADVSKDFLASRKSRGLTIIARLKKGLTLDAAQPVLNVIAHRLSAQYATTDKWRSLTAYALSPMSPIKNPDAPNAMRLVTALFLILAGFVLVLACLNVANLLLARASGREREMAVRAAVGGGRNRLIRQLLTESLLLASLGCAAGIALGLVVSRSLESINLGADIPLILDFQFDWRVFAYAFCAALLTAVFVGVVPALRATRVSLNNLLHESAGTATADRQRTRGTLVVAQVGGSLMLLIVAGLFVRSLRNVRQLNLGFDPSHVLSFTIDTHETGYNEDQARDFLQSLLPRVRALPGVETGSFATAVPMGFYSYNAELKIEDYHQSSGQRAPSADYSAVSSEYFETMRIPIVHGRAILDSDGQTSPHVAVINEAMAEKYWPGVNPIGRHFTTTNDPENPADVVGVVGNSRTDNLWGPVGPYMYLSLAQHHQTPITLQLRTSLPLVTIDHEVVGLIHSRAPTMPVFGIQTMTEALDTVNGLLLFQIAAGLAASLGILGIALAIVGVYGVVSYGASQRTHEVGVRMALGAQPAQVLKLIFGQGLFIVGGGIFLGALAAAGVARLVRNFLVGVAAIDPLTYISAALLLAAVALLACYIPARRATKVDPMVALRYE